MMSSLNRFVYIFLLMSCIGYAYIEDIDNNYNKKVDNSSDIIRSKDDNNKLIIKNRILKDNKQDSTKEMEALLLGRNDYNQKDIIKMRMNMKPLLCVTFIKADYKNLKLLQNNMNIMKDHCEWAIIFYGGYDDLMNKFCELTIKNEILSVNDISTSLILKNNHQNDNIDSYNKIIDSYNIINNQINHDQNIIGDNKQKIILCKKAEIAKEKVFIDIPTSDGKIVRQFRSIPKSVLYQELLSISITSYKHIFIMDEDISLNDFHMTRFLSLWKCSFQQFNQENNNENNQNLNQQQEQQQFEYLLSPLIVQPLIAERTQYFPYVYAKLWEMQRFSGSIAATVGLVEQQVPFFDSLFLEWYIKYVLINIKDIALKYGVDQTIDKTWCKAAAAYSKYILDIDYHQYNSASCAIIIDTPPVHHKNFHSLSNKRVNRKYYREKAQVVNSFYKSLFPNWVLEDITRSISPIDPKYGKNFRIIKHYNKTCMIDN